MDGQNRQGGFEEVFGDLFRGATMDSILTDSLCIIGMLYLILHVRRSVGSLREGIAGSIGSPQQALGPSRPHLWNSQERPVVGAGMSAPTAGNHRRPERS